jgi:hypothetical protein
MLKKFRIINLLSPPAPSAAADWLCAFPALRALFFFLLAKTHRGGQDAEPQRNCGPPLSSWLLCLISCPLLLATFLPTFNYA